MHRRSGIRSTEQCTSFNLCSDIKKTKNLSNSTSLLYIRILLGYCCDALEDKHPLHYLSKMFHYGEVNKEVTSKIKFVLPCNNLFYYFQV